MLACRQRSVLFDMLHYPHMESFWKIRLTCGNGKEQETPTST